MKRSMITDKNVDHFRYNFRFLYMNAAHVTLCKEYFLLVIPYN